MSNTKLVCRLCLNIVLTDKFSSFDSTVIENIQVLMPEMKLTPSTNLVICTECKESLEESCKLKRTCSSSNKLIKFLKNYLGVTHTVELKELIKGNNKKHDENWAKNEHVCRICLKSNEGAYSSITQAKTEFNLVLSSCLLTLDENLTIDPQICKICMDALHKMCRFVTQCVKVENKVKTYSETIPGKIVDLVTVAESVNGEERNPPLQSVEEKSSMKQTGIDKLPLTGEGNLPIDDQKKDISAVVRRIHHGKIDPFDFKEKLQYLIFSRKLLLKQWLDEVDTFKAKQQWSDVTVANKVLQKLEKSPELHNFFHKYRTNWPDFKEKLLLAFPGEDDYCSKIVELVQRKKKLLETYVEYYREKMDMLQSFNFTDEQNVSFLVGGISQVHLRCECSMARYKKPEDMLPFFMSCDSRKADQPPEAGRRKNKRRQQNAGAECACCDQTGHSSLDCPLIKANKAQARQMASAADKHQNVIIVHENKVISSEVPKEKFVKAESEATQPTQKITKAVAKEPTTNQGQKCVCCDKLGHSSLECPLIRNGPETDESRGLEGLTNRPQMAEVAVIEENVTKHVGEEKTVESSGPKCTFCDQSSHSSLVCPRIDTKGASASVEGSSKRSAIKIVLDKGKLNRPVSHVAGTGQEDLICEVKEPQPEKKAKEDDAKKKCSCCDKLGHTSLDCPLITQKTANPPAKKSAQTPFNTKKKNQKNETKAAQKKTTQATFTVKKAQKNAFKTPANSNAQVSAKNKTTGWPVQPGGQNVMAQASYQWCTSCRQWGHAAIACPLTPFWGQAQKVGLKDTAAKVAQPVPSVQAASAGQNATQTSKDEGQDPSPQNKRGHGKRCLCCNNVGHSSVECPLLNAKRKKLNEPDNPNAAVKDQNRSLYSSLEESGANVNRNTTPGAKINPKRLLEGTSGPSCQGQPPKKAKARCYFCDEAGHSSVDCFRARFEQMQQEARGRVVHPQTQEPFTDPSVISFSATACEFCKGSGHRSSECFYARNAPMTAGTSRQCSLCGKFGHTLSNCPRKKTGGKQRSAFGN